MAGPLLLALTSGLTTSLFAQVDFRNLDDDRPLVTEDAYPVERHAFEFLLPYSFEAERGGGRVHAVVPELAYGIIRNGQLGIKAPVAAVTGALDDNSGLAGLRVFGMYNLNTEHPALPALAFRADVLLPVGSLGGDATRLTLKAIATRSWGRNRVHLNAAWTLGRERHVAVLEPGSRWRYGLAIDRTLFRQNLLIAGEVVAERELRGEPVAVNGAEGMRYQWTPTTVLDLGIRRRFRNVSGPDFGLTLGLSHAFAIPWLMSTGR